MWLKKDKHYIYLCTTYRMWIFNHQIDLVKMFTSSFASNSPDLYKYFEYDELTGHPQHMTILERTIPEMTIFGDYNKKEFRKMKKNSFIERTSVDWSYDSNGTLEFFQDNKGNWWRNDIYNKGLGCPFDTKMDELTSEVQKIVAFLEDYEDDTLQMRVDNCETLREKFHYLIRVATEYVNVY